MVNDAAVRAENLRDLKATISELAKEDDREVIFKETSPMRRKVTLYSLANGEEIQVARAQLEAMLSKRGPQGYLWTADKSKAPVYREGDVLCFLHPDAPEREVLNKIGISTVCMSAHHPNRHAMEIIAQHKHRNQWDAYQAYLAEEQAREDRDMQRQQLEATLALARAAAGNVVTPVEDFTCDVCGTVAKSAAGLAAHKRSHITAEPASLE